MHAPRSIPVPTVANLGISAVERDTGLSKDTLRVWERRYGFPQPLRDSFGERSYPPTQVETLRLIRRLMDRGLRPSKLIGRPIEELIRLGQSNPERAALQGRAPSPNLDGYVAQLRAHAVEDLRRGLSQALLRHGMADFVTDIIAPLTEKIGDAWMGGTLAIYEEHLFTETVQTVLRGAIAALPAPAAREATSRPHVLLTTFPGEEHSLGLLMVEALLTLEGARCISLGTGTPVDEIARAALAHRADVVALSFSQAYPAGQVSDGLRALHAALPETSEIWAGGGNAALNKKPIPAVRVVGALTKLQSAVAEWRGCHTAIEDAA